MCLFILHTTSIDQPLQQTPTCPVSSPSTSWPYCLLRKPLRCYQTTTTRLSSIHQGTSPRSRAVSCHSPRLLCDQISTVRSCEAVAIYERTNTDGDQHTSLTQSVMALQRSLEDVVATSGSNFQILAKLSDPHDTNRRRVAPVLSLVPLIGAQDAELTPIACASNTTCDVVPSSLNSTNRNFSIRRRT